MIKEINDTIDFIMKNDPASKSKLEVLLLYPGLHAVISHKISNFLYKKDLFFSARLVSHMFRFFTNIEIHPSYLPTGVFLSISFCEVLRLLLHQLGL